jgi:hypothetical protein
MIYDPDQSYLSVSHSLVFNMLNSQANGPFECLQDLVRFPRDSNFQHLPQDR